VEKISFSAAVLAGGDSKRMGTNKAFLKLDGKDLIEIVYEKIAALFKEVIIVTDRPGEFRHLPAILTTDFIREGDKNALRGIQAGLTVASFPACFVVACDMPFLSLPLIHYMSSFTEDFDVVVPRVGTYYEPLFAFYNKNALGTINSHLAGKKFKIFDLFSVLKVKEISEQRIRTFDPKMLSFFNINTREDFDKAREFYRPIKNILC